MITLKGPAATVQLPYRLDGDKLIFTINGETQTLTRVGAAGGAAAANPFGIAAGGAPGGAAPAANADPAAGVYVAQEASVDPTIVMTMTQYLTLWPDGSVGWTKAEGGATRTQVSDSIERFSSWRTNPENKGQTYGTWQRNGASLVIQWRIWNNLRCDGVIDASGTLRLPKMGILQEGATLEFKKQ